MDWFSGGSIPQLDIQIDDTQKKSAKYFAALNLYCPTGIVQPWTWTLKYLLFLEETKSSQLVGKAAEFKFESKFEILPIILQSLPKSTPEGNQRLSSLS